MDVLIAGLALFFVPHLLVFTPLRGALKTRLGERIYKPLFALVSLVGLGLIVWGFGRTRAGPADADIVYQPLDGARHLSMLLVLLGFIALAASFHKGRLKLWLRNPMSIGVGLWAIGHLIANGQRSHVILFGAFLAYAILDIAMNTTRGRRPEYIPKPRHDLITLVAGVVMYAVFLLWFHPYVLNLPIVSV